MDKYDDQWVREVGADYVDGAAGFFIFMKQKLSELGEKDDSMCPMWKS